MGLPCGGRAAQRRTQPVRARVDRPTRAHRSAVLDGAAPGSPADRGRVATARGARSGIDGPVERVDLVSTAATVLYLAARGGLVGLGTVALLAGPLGLLALSGNVNGFVLAALVLAWRYRDRPVLVGPFVAFAIAMKLTPVLLVFWLLGSRRIPAVVATAVSLAVIALISVAGAGLDAHLDWLRTVPGSQPSPQSIATTLHLSSAVVSVAGALIVAVIAWRANERWAFAAAVVVSCLITPAFYFQALGLMAAAAAPWTTPGTWVRSRTTSAEPTVEAPA